MRFPIGFNNEMSGLVIENTKVMNKQLLIFIGFVILMSGCKSVSKVQTTDLGITAEQVLDQYGAPENIQKILEYEVWSYEDSNSFRNGERTDECQFFFKKNKLSRPVKCSTTRREPANKKGTSSRKFVINY